MFKLDLEKAEELEIKFPTSVGSQRKQKHSRKIIYFCFTEYTEASDCVDHNKLWKFLKRWEYQITVLVSWEVCIRVKKQQLESDMEQQTGSKLEKEYVKAVYCRSAYLPNMQRTSWEMSCWAQMLM